MDHGGYATTALRSTTRHYVSLGDSLAASVRPTGDLTHGYAEQLHASLAAREPKLRLVKLGCPGESTTSMLEASQYPAVASSCGPPASYRHTYPHRTQLAEALAFLRAHRGFVRLVTINIGGNDLLGAGEIAENLPVILRRLAAEAGPEVPIVGMNYYHRFLPLVWQATHDPAALQQQVDSIVGFNDLLEGIYRAAGDRVADVETEFRVTDTTPLRTAHRATCSARARGPGCARRSCWAPTCTPTPTATAR